MPAIRRSAVSPETLVCLSREQIAFISSPEFREWTEQSLNAAAPALFQESEEPTSSRASGVATAPLLTAAGEKYLFQRLNYFRFRASAELEKRPTRTRQQAAQRFLSEAQQARDQLARSNLRLVAGLAHRFATSQQEVDDLLSEGSVILLKAIDKFDYRRGFRFSTYATHAVQRHYVRVTQRQKRVRAREQVSWSEAGFSPVAPDAADPVYDFRLAEQFIQRFDECLDPREAQILENRFGLCAAESADTLKEIAERVGLSKERVRQLQIRAISKLQDLALRLNLRPELCSLS